jgi:thiol-disulfide isomerase/thioredoxin
MNLRNCMGLIVRAGMASAAAWAGAAVWAQGEDRTVELILREVQAIGEPEFDPARKSEHGYLESYKKRQHELYQRKAALLLEAYRRFPGDARAAEWLRRRWHLLAWNQHPRDVVAEVLADIERILTDEKTLPEGVPQEAAYWRAYFNVFGEGNDVRAVQASVESFLAASPGDERGASLLTELAEHPGTDDATKLPLYQRLTREFPDSHGGKYAMGKMRRIRERGMPFELEFQDAISGRRMSIAEFRGKVVVVDFWATTCGPCVAALPAMKELYAKRKEKGLEVVGVSLDESEEMGGLSALRSFVKKHDVPWPQYYQGNGYDSDFSRSWGVGSAPTIFVLDRQGRLRFTQAEKELEKIVENLLDE